MIVAVVPAAGLSRRMGQCKQLLPFAGTTVIGHVVDELARSRVDEVRVVVGHEAGRMREEMASRNVRIIVNPDYAHSDMLASIRCGLADLPPDCRGVLVALADQPAIRAELVDALIERFEAAARRGVGNDCGTTSCCPLPTPLRHGIVVPVHAGRRGHPILLAASYRNELMNGYDDVGLRGLVAAHAGEVLELPVPESLALSDMDYPHEYQRELARYGRGVQD